MRRLYRYECRDCEHQFSELIEEADRTIGCKCPDCGGHGDYIIGSPYLKASLDSDKWVKNRQSHMKKEQKNLRNHGTYD